MDNKPSSNKREARFKAFVEQVSSGRIYTQIENMTAFYTRMTKNQFIHAASIWAEAYIVYYAYDSADYKQSKMEPTYHYTVVLEEKDNYPPFEYPDPLKQFKPK